MKTLISSFISILILLPGLFCQDMIPDELVGTWAIRLDGEGEIPSQIFRHVFSKDSDRSGTHEFYWLFKRAEDKEFTVVAAVVGDLKIEGDKFTSVLQKAGTQQKEPMVMSFYDEIHWYQKGDGMFEKFPQQEVSFFKVDGDKLILKWDHNNDGDFEDDGEYDVFSRQK